jgi:hypothetical protein
MGLTGSKAIFEEVEQNNVETVATEVQFPTSKTEANIEETIIAEMHTNEQTKSMNEVMLIC